MGLSFVWCIGSFVCVSQYSKIIANRKARHRNSNAPPFDYTFLKFDDNRFMGEGRNSRRGVLEVTDGGVAVRARYVHGAKRRVIAEHALLRFGALVENECSRNADPFVALHGAKFHLGVGLDLFCNALAFARLDIQFALK